MEPLVQAALLSLLPVVELRGGIPVAYAQGANIWAALIVSILFNLVAIPVTFLFMEFVHDSLLRSSIYRRACEPFLERTRAKARASIERWGYWGLALFVAVPLPGTGAYTGTLAAWLFGMDKKKATLAVALGVVGAGVIVAIVTVAGGAALKALFLGNI